VENEKCSYVILSEAKNLRHCKREILRRPSLSADRQAQDDIYAFPQQELNRTFFEEV
jgi:hypothetical protein